MSNIKVVREPSYYQKKKYQVISYTKWTKRWVNVPAHTFSLAEVIAQAQQNFADKRGLGINGPR